MYVEASKIFISENHFKVLVNKGESTIVCQTGFSNCCDSKISQNNQTDILVSGWCEDVLVLVLVRSLKSSIFSSTSFHMGKTFWGVVTAAVEQSRGKANTVAQGDGKFGPRGWPQDPSKPKKKQTDILPQIFSSKLSILFVRVQAKT